jgi:hypothetical protein
VGETVGLFLVGLNDYQERLKEDAVKAARHLGFALEVAIADNDAARQLTQIKPAIDRRASAGLVALLVCPARCRSTGFRSSAAMDHRGSASGWCANAGSPARWRCRSSFPGIEELGRRAG